MSTQHLPRKELYAPDQVQRTLYALVNDFYKRRTQYLTVAGTLVVLALAAWGWTKYAQTQKIKQANLFYAAQKAWSAALNDQNIQKNSGVQAMERFVEKNNAGFLNHIGTIRLGQSYAKQGDWKQAESSFQQVLQSADAPSFLKNTARISLVSLKEQQGQWDEAQKMIQNLSGSSWNDVRLHMQARIAMSTGDFVNAKKLLEELVSIQPASAFRQEAEQLLMTLE